MMFCVDVRAASKEAAAKLGERVVLARPRYCSIAELPEGQDGPEAAFDLYELVPGEPPFLMVHDQLDSAGDTVVEDW